METNKSKSMNRFFHSIPTQLCLVCSVHPFTLINCSPSHLHSLVIVHSCLFDDDTKVGSKLSVVCGLGNIQSSRSQSWIPAPKPLVLLVNSVVSPQLLRAGITGAAHLHFNFNLLRLQITDSTSSRSSNYPTGNGVRKFVPTLKC